MISGTTVKHLSHSDVEKIACAFPQDDAEQFKLGEVLHDFDADLADLRQKQTSLLAIRQGMTQQLLTGRMTLV